MNLKKHVRIYLDSMGYDESDFIPCEICGKKAVDIHHINPRGIGGSKNKDDPQNLIALCREDHIFYEGKKEFKEHLKTIHYGNLERCGWV